MRKNIAKVIQAFRDGRQAKGDSKGTCSTDGNVIYSYRMPIARRRRNGVIEIVESGRAPSNTTRNQIYAVKTEFKYLTSDYTVR